MQFKFTYLLPTLLTLVFSSESGYTCDNFLTSANLGKAINPCGQPMGSASGENIACSLALPYIQTALSNYKLNTPQQAAFYLSVMNTESAGLSFNRNHFPGRPGQGTRSMMMPKNLYAFVTDNKSILDAEPELKSLTATAYDENDNIRKEGVLKILMQDKYSFLPGAWWIAKGSGIVNPECANFSQLLGSADSATDANVSHLLQDCVVVDNVPTRLALYKSTLAALCP